MDQSRFQEAQQAYDAGDFRVAAKGFLAAAGRGPDGNGAAYHMAGNALMRLRRYQDAVTVYGHALRDGVYDRRGAVLANLGVAYVELAEYAEAARSYEAALEEPDYTTPYKAYQGMAGALLERGRVEDAAIAYRKAALDPGNPDPGKALVNLGLCFMGLGRPADAVEAYRAALGFDQYEGRGLALANLGQAFVALGQYEDAVKSFEKATQMHGRQLSAAASAAYAVAIEHVRPAAAQREVVDGWVTGDQPPLASPEPGPFDAIHAVMQTPAAQLSAQASDGLSVSAVAETPAPAAEMPAGPTASAAELGAIAVDLGDVWISDPERDTIPGTTMSWESIGVPDTTGTIPAADVAAAAALTADAAPAPAPAQAAAAADIPAHSLAPFDNENAIADLGFGDEEAVSEFFSATDEELKARDREARRAERHARGPLAVWRPIILAIVAVLVVVGALVGAFQLGYGWPTQTQTVAGMLSAYQQGNAVDSFWVAAPSKSISKEMAKIPPVKSYSVDNVVQGATTSTAQVTVTPKTGAALHYTITLSREGVGWKVNGVDNDWSTTGG